MKAEANGIAVPVPPGWDVRIGQSSGTRSGLGSHPIVHAGTFGLPAKRAEFGGGAVEVMGLSDVFVVLFEFGQESLGQPLFAPAGLPRQLDPASFQPYQLQRIIPGQLGLQRFFTEQGRPFCLYAVLGGPANRAALVGALNVLLEGITVTPPGQP